jgi:hypothetical protein
VGINIPTGKEISKLCHVLSMSNVCACRHGRDAHRWSTDAEDPEPCTMCGCPTFRDEDEERKW